MPCRGEGCEAHAHALEALQGAWVNADCPGEQYLVDGQHVTRTDSQGSRHFTLQWDLCRNQLQWGTRGKLYLTWLDHGAVAWVPPPRPQRPSRAWRWQRTHSAPPTLRPRSATGGVMLMPASPARGFCAPGLQPSHQPLAYRALPWSPSSSYGPCRGPGGRHSRDLEQQPYQLRRPVHRDGRYSGGGRRVYPSFGGQEARLACGLCPSEVFDLMFRDITPDDYETLLRLDESVARPTATVASIQALPIRRGKELPGKDCSVCLCAFEAEDTVVSLPCRCSSPFHRDCIAKWLGECRRACPLCGEEVLSPP